MSGSTGQDVGPAPGEPPSVPSRCPYCHAPCAGGENLVLCRACVAPHHAECWRALGRCGACKHPRGLDRFGEFRVHRGAPQADASVVPGRRGLFAAGALVTAWLAWSACRGAPPLELQVLRPPAGETVDREVLLVSGRLALPLPDDVVVRVRGTPTPIDASGSFAASLRLGEGAHTVEVTGRAGEIERRTTVDVVVDLPPRMWVDTPPDGFTTTEAQVRIVGRVEDAELVEARADDQPVATAAGPGPFSLDVPLTRGHNDLRLRAVDRAGRHSTDVLLGVTRTLPPDDASPRPTFLHPREGEVVMSTRVRVVLRVAGDALCDVWLDGRDVRDHLTVSGEGVATGQLEVAAGSHVLECGQGRRAIASRRAFVVVPR